MPVTDAREDVRWHVQSMRRAGGDLGIPPGGIETFIRDAREAFLDAYGEHDAMLLRALEVEKETYEFEYAATFIPDWMYAPVGGMRWLMGVRAT